MSVCYFNDKLKWSNLTSRHQGEAAGQGEVTKHPLIVWFPEHDVKSGLDGNWGNELQDVQNTFNSNPEETGIYQSMLEGFQGVILYTSKFESWAV